MSCNDTSSSGESSSSGGIPVYSIIVLGVLLVLSGLFSGLNLGLMSLDNVGLQIVLGSGDDDEKRYASGLLPLRSKGNLLLCTLLLGNTAVNAVLAILMAELVGGTIGSIAVTFGIVIFGEIIPQSVCSRNGLAIGYYTRYVVWAFLVVLWLIAAPISWVLDYVLEEEVGSVFNREQMRKLFDMHAVEKYGNLNHDEVTILKGALNLTKTSVREIMTPIDQVFMLDIDARMDFKSMRRILSKGHSRIPIYDGGRDNVVKLLLVKNMIMLNPGDEVPLRSLIEEGFPDPIYVKPSIKLGEMLNEFQNGRSHLAIVSETREELVLADAKRPDAKGVRIGRQNIGIVTLEDVIETLIQEPIADETEEGPAGENIGQKFLRVLGRKNKFKSSTLSTHEGKAISSFLQNMFVPFKNDTIPARSLEKLILSSKIVQLKPGTQGDAPIRIYTLGEASDCCTVVLAGSLSVTVSEQGFRSEATIWKMLALHALTDDKYVADFSATVVREATVLQIKRSDYKAAVEGKEFKLPAPTQAGPTEGNMTVLERLPTVNTLQKAYDTGFDVQARAEARANLESRAKSPDRIEGQGRSARARGSQPKSSLGDIPMTEMGVRTSRNPQTSITEIAEDEPEGKTASASRLLGEKEGKE